MKTIEEKAKAYDEIIERAKTMLSAGEVMYGKENNASQLITDLIPELAESEDERMSNIILEGFKNYSRSFSEWNDVPVERIIAYLERQKEQKPVEDRGAVEPTPKQNYSGLNDFERAIHRGFLCAGVENVPVTIIKETAQDCLAHQKPVEWSDKDKNIFSLALNLIQHSDDCSGILDKELATKWLTELPSRFVPQPKQEWSEEDKRAVNDAIVALSMYANGEIPNILPSQLLENVERLKSLRPSWKPSEEQMKVLKDAIIYVESSESNFKGSGSLLESLYEQLKKLCK